jgi:hypothetical protein
MSERNDIENIECKLFRFFETEDATKLDKKFSKFAEVDTKDPSYTKLKNELQAEIACIVKYITKY